MSIDHKPVRDGDTICVIGGGPGGAACAIALMNEARTLGKDIRVVVMEHKKFNEYRHYNQCIGVLSPPLEDILEEQLELRLPDELILKKIKGYCLHSDVLSLDLVGKDEGKSYAVSRSRFDAFMLEEARKAGATVVHNRVTGLEVSDEGVLVYSEGENCEAVAVVGAFGMDEGTGNVLEQATPYRRPDFLNTIITHIYPGEEFLSQMDSTIHAFMLSQAGVEFGAVTPKFDHLSINIAGRRVSSKAMLEFLRSAPVQKFLPPHKRREKPLNYFKGKFPIAPADHLFGDRYVTIGDAAGLMRPFKGKGINSACLTGIYAARSIMHHGVSREAFRNYYFKDCFELTSDLPYGRMIRFFANLCTRFGFMDHLLAMAAVDSRMMDCLFNSVSGHKAYKQIIWETVSLPVVYRLLGELCKRFVFHRVATLPATVPGAGRVAVAD